MIIQGINDEHIPGLTLRHSFFLLQKASQIINRGHILPFFGKGCYHVIGSSTDALPHYVKRVSVGKYKWDPDDPRNGCLAFKKDKICSHIVAAAKHTGEFKSLVEGFKRKKSNAKITEIGMHRIAAGNVKKSGRVRKRRAVEVASVTEVEEVIKPPLKMKTVKQNGCHLAVQPRKKDFIVELVDDHPQVRICWGCRIKFPRQVNNSPFGAPDNLILSPLEQGSKCLANGILQIFEKKSARYYHPNIQCVRKGNNGGNATFSGSDIDCETVLGRLEDEHKDLLRRNFKVTLE